MAFIKSCILLFQCMDAPVWLTSLRQFLLTALGRETAYLVVQLHVKSSPAKKLVDLPRPELVYLTGSSTLGNVDSIRSCLSILNINEIS